MFCLLFVLLDFLLKAVQKYEKYVYVTPILNPFPRGKDLLSLRSKFIMFCAIGNVGFSHYRPQSEALYVVFGA